jgi:signal peptidase II
MRKLFVSAPTVTLRNTLFVWRLIGWLMLAGLIIVLDQASKLWIIEKIQLGQAIELSSFLNIVLVHNSGAAFSFLSEASGWQRWFFVVLALGISGWLVILIWRHINERCMPLACSLILGGALGNVIDRLLFGAVVDFIDFHIASYHWPAFNVADSAISIGVVLLLWDQLRRKN